MEPRSKGQTVQYLPPNSGAGRGSHHDAHYILVELLVEEPIHRPGSNSHESLAFAAAGARELPSSKTGDRPLLPQTVKLRRRTRMPSSQSQADAIWEGNLSQGHGTITLESGIISDQPITWASRTQRTRGKTSPEELIAAAHAGCYGMALSNTLDKAGHPSKRLDITAVCTFETGGDGAKIS